MCRIDDAEGGDWLTAPTVRKAAKEHRCDDCQRTIAVDERYYYATWKDDEFDPGIATIKMCGQCVAAGRWLTKVCGGFMWPAVREELEEHWDEEWELRSNGLLWLITCGAAGWQRRGALASRPTVGAHSALRHPRGLRPSP